MRVLITGGTGALAREIITAAHSPDITLRSTSRRPFAASVAQTEWIGADLASGDGLPNALRNVDVVIHTASDVKRSQQVDVEGTRRLLTAAQAAGVGHVIFVSIVGIDAIPLQYYRRKRVAEREIETGPVPYSILRATQFHSLIDIGITTAARFPLMIPLPADFKIQSVSTRDVAVRLWQAVTAGPQQRLPDFVGPDIMTLGDAAREWKAARSIVKPVMPLFIPGKIAAAFRAGMNTVATGPRGTSTWREWLAARYSATHA